MMIPSDNAQAVLANITSPVGTGEARRVPVAPPNATGDGPPPAITGSLSGFLLLFVASRLLYLVLIDPPHLFPYAGQESYRGTIAQELITGPTLPFTEYRANNHSLGSLVIGGIAAVVSWGLYGPASSSSLLAQGAPAAVANDGTNTGRNSRNV